MPSKAIIGDFEGSDGIKGPGRFTSPDIVDNERTALLAVPNAPAHSIGLGDEQQPSPTSSGASTPTLKEKKFPWRFALTIYGLNVVTPLSFELIFPFISKHLSKKHTC